MLHDTHTPSPLPGDTTTTLQALLPALVNGLSTTAGAEEAGSKKAHLGVAIGGIVAGILGSACVASASGEVADGLHAASYPWSHEGIFDSYDHASIRRGHQVYQQVQQY